MKVHAYHGDITTCAVDAIVNAANPSVLGGGGVDGAIHRAAGRELWKACRALPQIKPNVRCLVGECVSTLGFNLKAEFVIHTPGPIFEAGRETRFAGEERSTDEEAVKLLASCIRNSLLEALKLGCKSIAFPAISCGVYGCSPAVFAKVARGVLREHVGDLFREIHFVLFTPEELDSFKAGWAAFEA